MAPEVGMEGVGPHGVGPPAAQTKFAPRVFAIPDAGNRDGRGVRPGGPPECPPYQIRVI